jgi:hypothetical protein
MPGKRTSMTDKMIYMDKNWEVVEDPRQATLVKVIRDNGDIEFGVREEVKSNAFEGHRGRPGERGGSLPRSAGTGPTPKSVLDIYRRKMKNEPAITKDMQELSDEKNGRLAGLNHRTKDEASFVRKVKADAAEKGVTLDEAAGQINDAVRYTMVFESPEEFAGSVKATEASMLEKGYSRYDHKRKNFYDEAVGDRTYEGYNTVWVSPTGDTFELQFHTEQSLKIKGINHDLYKIARQTNDQAERARLVQQMIENWRSPEYKRPLNYKSLTSGD